MALSASRSARIFLWTQSPRSSIKCPAIRPSGMPSGDVMELRSEPTNTVWPFPFTLQDWDHTPTAVQAYVHTLQDELTRLRECVEALEARLHVNSTTSHRPPSSDS